MAYFPDITPDVLGCGSKYRRVPMWGPKSIHPRGFPQFTSFRKFARPRWVIDVAWTFLTLAQARNIDALARGQLVTALPFDWFDWYPWWWESVLVGIGDGTTTLWTLPAKEVTDVTIYAGGATSAGGSDRQIIGGNLVRATGPGGEDSISLFAPVPNGRPAYAYFRGRRRWSVTLDADSQQPFSRDLETGTYNLTMKLIQSKAVSGS